MPLDSKKHELAEMNEELKKLESRFRFEKSDLNLERKIDLLKKDIENLNGEISILEKMADLEKRYNNNEPIIYSYSDNGEMDDILLTSNDVNYERAYFQQKSLLDLEYAHYNKLPIKYNRGNTVYFDDAKYEDFYNKKKQELLNLKIDERAKSSIKPYEGKHFKKDNSDLGGNTKKEDKKADNTYFGGHFKPNNLDMEYAVFKKDGVLNVVGNFTNEWLSENLDKLEGNLVKDSNIKEINLWNKIGYGKTPLDGMDIDVELSKDGELKIIGDVDAIEYHNNSLSDVKKNGAHFGVDSDVSKRVNDTSQGKDDPGVAIAPYNSNEKGISDVQDKKDYSGLDVIPSMSDDLDAEDLKHGAQPMKSGRKKVVNRKKPKLGLIEKFKNLKTWQKALIVAGAIAAIGIGIFVVGTAITNGSNVASQTDVMNNMSHQVNNMINQVSGTVNDTVNATANSAPSLDFSSIGEGHTVFTNAYDAASNANGVISNQWFSSNPVDVFNTATNSYMGLTPEQLANPEFMAELAKDPNNALLFGNSISDPSGFIGLDDVIREVTKGGMMR